MVEYLYIKLDFKALKFSERLTSKELGDIVISHIESKRVFNDLSCILIKKAHEKLLNLKGE